MYGSIKIGTAFGIPVRLHWTFLVLISVFAYFAEGPIWIGLLMVIGVFGSVLLHELGHSLVARAFGIRVIDITFWPLGGMARMSEIPEVPRTEGLVAIAGPAVNFALAPLGFAGMVTGELLGAGGLRYAAAVFTGVNLVMGTFNLVPAFPMDGGRILRAWLGRSMDWVSATEQAVAVGRVFAGIMFFGALALMFTSQSLCALPLIAVFVWVAGGRELLAVRMRHGLPPFGRSRVFAPGYADVEAGPSPPPPSEPSGAQRPTDWAGPHGGFSEETIRELERYRGRLRRPPDLDA